jgi:hypothetical protein
MKKYLIEVDDLIWSKFIDKIPRRIKNINDVIIKFFEVATKEEINKIVEKIEDEIQTSNKRK